MDEMAVIEKLRKVKLFDTIKNDRERLAKLAGIVSIRRCKAGHEVIKEGDEGADLYILKKGSVSVLKRTLDNELYTIETLKADEAPFFGELALLDKELRSASVLADSDCEFVVINRDDFNRLGDEDPLLGLLVTRAVGMALSRRLRKANQDMITLFEALVGEVAESSNLEEVPE
ncbi:MAG: cyclic nucleotide-binding domain-containing protein [Desulfobacterales bacterium]|nr:cyclic nucleotide-binding domain-containing protein [Desulfobacterales bacterium]